ASGKPPAPPSSEGLLASIHELSENKSEPDLSADDRVVDGLSALSASTATQESAPVVAANEAPVNEARSIKVDTHKLDFLVDMVGEMVIAQSLVKHDPDL